MPTYQCAPDKPPVECIDRLMEMYQSGELLSIEASGHAAYIYAYVADRLTRDPKVLNGTQADLEFQEKLFALASQLAGEQRGEITTFGVLPGIVIQVIAAQVVRYLIEQLQRPEVWDQILEYLRQLLEKGKRP